MLPPHEHSGAFAILTAPAAAVDYRLHLSIL
jgi:hypothetical protein